MSTTGSDAWQAEDKGPEILWACWVMAGLTTAFVSARVWCRRRIGRHFYGDDYCCILSLVRFVRKVMTGFPTLT